MTTKVFTINNVSYNLIANNNDFDPCGGCSFYADRESCNKSREIASCARAVWKEIQSDKPAVTPIANQANSTNNSLNRKQQMTTKVITIKSVKYNLVSDNDDNSCESCALYHDPVYDYANCMAISSETKCGYLSHWKEVKTASTPAVTTSVSTFVYDKHYQTLILSRDNQEVQRMQVQPQELQALLQFLSDVKLSDLVVDSSKDSE